MSDTTHNAANETRATGARAAKAVEAAEDAGGIDFREGLKAFSSLVDPAKALQEFGKFSTELIKILIGSSQVSPSPKDWRFKDPAWRENPFYKRLGQGYLALDEWLNNLLSERGDWRRGSVHGWTRRHTSDHRREVPVWDSRRVSNGREHRWALSAAPTGNDGHRD